MHNIFRCEKFTLLSRKFIEPLPSNCRPLKKIISAWRGVLVH